MRPRDWRSFVAGAALGIVIVKLLPVAKKAARPLARELIGGALALGEQTRSMMAQAREEMENMVAEAKYEQEQRSQLSGQLPPVTQDPGPEPPFIESP